MNADRYKFQINQGGRLEISVGGSVVSVSTPESHTFRAIHQQARDIAAMVEALKFARQFIRDGGDIEHAIALVDGALIKAGA